jgi:hypothetical protein
VSVCIRQLRKLFPCHVIGLLVISKSKLCGVIRGEERFRADVLGIRCHPILLFDFCVKVTSVCTLQPAHSSVCELYCFIPRNAVWNTVPASNFERFFFSFMCRCVGSYHIIHVFNILLLRGGVMCEQRCWYLNLRCSIPKFLYNIMGKGRSNTTIVDVKLYIMCNVKIGLLNIKHSYHTSTLCYILLCSSLLLL